MINTLPVLRVYNGPDLKPELPQPIDDPAVVSVRVSEVLPLLAEAVLAERTWLRDFQHDEITLPVELYEMLKAYQYYSRPAG